MAYLLVLLLILLPILQYTHFSLPLLFFHIHLRNFHLTSILLQPIQIGAATKLLSFQVLIWPDHRHNG
jgi:hypothetical protein